MVRRQLLDRGLGVIGGALVVLALLGGWLPTQQAAAERENDSPAFTRLAIDYMRLLQQRRSFERDFHGGAFAGWTNRIHWRGFDLTPATPDNPGGEEQEINLQAGGFLQFEGLRVDAMASWADPFETTDFETPLYWEAAASYMFRIDQSLLKVGVRRNGLQALPTTDRIEWPTFVDEVFVNLLAATAPIQGAGAVNIYYTLDVIQRLDFEGDSEGTLIDVGFQTISTNSWVLGDVISLQGKISWNQEYLQPYGRFSTYLFSIKLLKDLSNWDAPGRGPIWFEFFASWSGSLNQRYYRDQLLLTAALWVIF